jgi:hypothetical protein
MQKRIFALLLLFSLASNLSAQKTETDSLTYYDDLFSELDLFLDSILAPRTLVIANIGITNTVLNYSKPGSSALDSRLKTVFSPTLGYFAKSGFGINLSAQIVRDSSRLKAYQLLATLSYDYLKSDAFITGISATRFFTKEGLPFYTSPLQNELGAYFTYRRWWAKPSLTARYGWGNRTNVQEQQTYITRLRLRLPGTTQTTATESIYDLSIAASLRHDFYKLNILGDRSVFRFTPQLTFAAGTQNYGLNESSNTYALNRGNNNPIVLRSKEQYLDQSLKFQPLSLSAFLKTELSYHKFFLQPQIGFHYFFPATDKHFTSAVLLNMGFVL